MSDMDQAFQEVLGGAPVVSPEEMARRKHLSAVYQTVFSGEMGLECLADLGDILHFFGAAYNDADIALSNAFKTILHRLGAWADDDIGRRDIIRKLRGMG